MTNKIPWSYYELLHEIYNYPDEIYNIFEALKPGLLDDKQDFTREWMGNYTSRAVRDPKALGTFLRDR